LTTCEADHYGIQDQEFIDKVKAYFLSEPNYEPLRKGSLWIEPLIGEAKDFHPLRRFFEWFTQSEHRRNDDRSGA
jgi:hypothetical protein